MRPARCAGAGWPGRPIWSWRGSVSSSVRVAARPASLRYYGIVDNGCLLSDGRLQHGSKADVTLTQDSILPALRGFDPFRGGEWKRVKGCTGSELWPLCMQGSIIPL